MSDEGSPTTYALIYAFLKKRSHEKAAAAVKKAAKDAGVVVLKDSLEETGQDDLNEIVRIWKEKKLKQSADTPSSESEDDDSDSETSSESDSSDTDSSSGRGAEPTSKANGRAGKKSKTNVSSESSSSEESDSTSESEREERAGIGAKPKATLKSIPKKHDSSSSVSSSDSSSTSSESSTSDSESSSSDSEPNTKHKKKGDKSVATPALKAETSSSNVKITKKRRVSVSGHAKVTAVDEEFKTPQVSKQNDGTHNGSATPLIIKDNGKKPRKSNTPFQRIRQEDVHFRDERLKDNSFMARGGAANDYGAKANQDLIVTRGDGFRKAKNKKKRGSYRGGEITLESHSIKFT